MALSGRFGLPPPRREPVPAAGLTTSNVRFLRVLSILTTQGRWQPLVISAEEAALQQYLQQWLTNPANRYSFSGQTKIEFLPVL